jgi:hypothetical protein
MSKGGRVLHIDKNKLKHHFIYGVTSESANKNQPT